MKKLALLAWLCCAALLFACVAPAEQPDAAPAAPQTAPEPGATEMPQQTEAPGVVSVLLTDLAERQVEIAGVPTKVVSLSAAATELLYALDAQAALVGVSPQCVYPQEASALTQVTTVEEALALQPELVFLNNQDIEGLIAPFEQAGIPVVCAQAEGYADLYASVALVAQIMGKDAAALMESMQEGVQQVESDAQGLLTQTALCVKQITEGDTIFIVGEGSFVTTLIEMAGGTPVIFDSPELTPGQLEVILGIDQLIELNPDVILAAASCAEDPIWETAPFEALTAVKEGRVFPIEDDLINCAGPRVAQSARAIFEALEQAQLS